MDFKWKWVVAEESKKNKVCSRVLSDVEEEGGDKKNLKLSKEKCGLLEEILSKNKSPKLVSLFMSFTCYLVLSRLWFTSLFSYHDLDHYNLLFLCKRKSLGHIDESPPSTSWSVVLE
jgi:hypothetical protein